MNKGLKIFITYAHKNSGSKGRIDNHPCRAEARGINRSSGMTTKFCLATSGA